MTLCKVFIYMLFFLATFELYILEKSCLFSLRIHHHTYDSFLKLNFFLVCFPFFCFNSNEDAMYNIQVFTVY